MFDREQFLADLATFVGFETGASNGRIYVARNPQIHVLMSSPAMGAAHAPGECLDSRSLDAYYRLCYETARMKVDGADG